MQGLKPRFKGWVALLQVLILCLALVVPVSAATSPSSSELLSILTHYRIVRGDERGNLNLDKPISRAEMITIMVRALGDEEEADFFKEFGPFKDVSADDWYAGYINYGAARKLVKGDGTGFVRPNANISWAEALTLLVRVINREPIGGDWPTNVMLTAAELGLVPSNVSMANINEPAIRGRIFESLAVAITTVETPNGRTYLQENVDSTPPSLSVNAITSPTDAEKVSVGGTTSSDAVRVTVNGKAAALNGTRWSTSVNLVAGANTLEIAAEDMAGNKETERVTVERNLPIARLEISGPNRVAPTTSAAYTVKAYNRSGDEVALTGVTGTVQGNIGVFNLQTGQFMAANTPGKGKIVVSYGNLSKSIDVEVLGANTTARSLRIRPVNNGLPVSSTQNMTVTVEVLDASGNVVTDDYGRHISLAASGISGLTVSPTTAQTSAGVATFTVRSSTPGTVSLSATSSSLNSDSAVATFSTNTRIVLTALPTSLLVGTNNVASRITATLQNEQGQAIPNNTGSDIRITLNSNGTDGILTDPYITIYRGLSNSTSSGDDALFNAGTNSGTANISGTITTGQNFTVSSTSVSVTAPQVGSATKWDLIYPPGNPMPNTPAYFSVRASDGNGATVPGNYAFQLEVSTSNNEPKTNGIPEGVQLFLSGHNVNPVSDGINEGVHNDGSDVIVRTVGGMATFTVQYNKVGQVHIKVIGMPGSTQAYGSDGSIGSSVSSVGLSSQTFTINFTTTPVGVSLVADSVLGNDKTIAAVRSGGGQTVKLRAYLTDGTRWVPGTTGYVTLEKVTGNSTYTPTNLTNATVTNGKVEFTVTSTGQPGTDVYRIKDAKTPSNQLLPNPISNELRVVVQDQNPGSVNVLAAHGLKNGIPGGGWYNVAPDDTHLQLELAPTNPTGVAIVKVYQNNYSQPFYSSDPVDLSTGTIRVLIPKSSLPNGRFQYQIALKNAVAETTPRVVTPDFITNAGYSTTMNISNARYDRVTNRLYIYGTGFGYSSSNNQDTVNTHLMNIVDASLNRSTGGGTVNLGPATLVSVTGNLITLEVSPLSAALAQLSGSDVTLSTDDGWYVKSTGELGRADTGNLVTPMAKIDHVTYDRTNRRLVLTGSGFTTGTVNPSLLRLVKNGQNDILLNGASSFRISDMEWSLTISHMSNVVNALEADLGYTLTAADGWFYDQSQSSIRQSTVAGIPIYERVLVSSVSYDATNEILIINGSGFTNGTVNPSALSIVNTGPDPDVIRPIGGTWLTGVDGSGNPQFTDSKIMIKLTTNPLSGSDRLTGSSLYVVGNAGWLTRTVEGNSRMGAPIPLYVLLLPPQN